MQVTTDLCAAPSIASLPLLDALVVVGSKGDAKSQVASPGRTWASLAALNVA